MEDRRRKTEVPATAGIFGLPPSVFRLKLPSMKYFIIAGEASGDLHGANLVKALHVKDEAAQIQAWGGDLMESAGAVISKHYRDLAFMGFAEVFKNLKTILNNFKRCKKQILSFQPDVLILIDYPGFNLRMAKWAKQNNIKVFYYISPQIWAWHSSRAHQIKKNVDRMYVILPFEKDFYKKYNYEVDFVGHPLLDVFHNFEKDVSFREQHALSEQAIIALLPGSRRQEIKIALGIMLQLVSRFKDYQFIIAGAPSIPAAYYAGLLKQQATEIDISSVKLVQNDTYQLLSHAQAALVTSGTATLETALLDVPQVVCYKGNTLSYYIARQLVNVKYISLVNLILDRPLLRELIQGEFNVDQLERELNLILDEDKRDEMRTAYAELREILGNEGASERAAELMVERIESPQINTD